MDIDVIICALTESAFLHQMTKKCLESLKNSESAHRINPIIVESSPRYDAGEYPYAAEVITAPLGPFNYHSNCNLGLSRCTGEWIALCNNDLIFHPGWFSQILAAADRFPEIKSFSPWNVFNDWHPSRFPEVMDFYRGYGIGYELTGWCIIARREIFDIIDLNTRVDFWFSDNIYADELQKHNIPHLLVRASRVDHIVSKTLLTLPPEEIKRLTEEQMKKY